MPPVPAPAAPAQPSAQSAFTTAALSVLGAIGTGIGVLGFLTFVGGAVWVARLRGLGFSGTYGISLMPRSELIATGADQLFAPAVAALLAMALVLGLLALARFFGLSAAEWTGIVVGLLALGAVALAWYYRHKVGSLLGEDALVPFLGAAGSFALGAGLIVLLARRAHDPSQPPSAARALALASAVAGTLLVCGAFETYALNLVHPHVRSAAVLAADGRGFAGYYVGQDADTLFLGVTSPRLDHSTSARSAARIVSVPLADGARIVVGATLGAPKTYVLAQELLADLRARDGSE